MKISIEHKSPIINTDSPAEEISHNVTIEHPCDDLDATQVARLVFYAMNAASYHPNSVARAFNEVALENGFSPDEE